MHLSISLHFFFSCSPRTRVPRKKYKNTKHFSIFIFAKTSLPWYIGNKKVIIIRRCLLPPPPLSLILSASLFLFRLQPALPNYPKFHINNGNKSNNCLFIFLFYLSLFFFSFVSYPPSLSSIFRSFYHPSSLLHAILQISSRVSINKRTWDNLNGRLTVRSNGGCERSDWPSSPFRSKLFPLMMIFLVCR